MYAVARLISRGVYTVSGPFHPFGGAVDIIVVQQPDGSFKSSPWYVRFGKFQGVLKTKEKVVNINVNGVEAAFHMYLDHKGEAYFLSDVVGEEEEEGEGDLVFSPPSSGEETDEQLQSETSIESKSCNFDANQKNSSDQNDKGDGKIVTRTNSRRSRILGLVFGRKSMKKENGSGEGNVERWDSLQRAEIAADLLEVKWSTNLPTDEVTNPNFNCLRTKEQDLEVSAMEISDVAEAQIETSAGLQNPGDETKMNSISGSVVDLQNPHLADLEVKASSQSVIEQASNDSNGLLGDGVYEEEIRKERVSSYIYCETSESSPVGVENSVEEAIEILSLSNGGLEKAQVHDGVHYEATELISEVNSRPESGALIVKENIHDIGLLSGENSCKIPKTESISGKIGSSIDSIAESIKIELDLLADLQMVTSDSIEAENLQIIPLKTITERLNDGKKLELKPVVFENQSMTKFSNSIHQDQEVESFVEENKMNNHYSSLESIVYPRGADADYLPMEVTNSSIPLPESSEEEDQFLFSDIDHLTSSTVQCKELISPDFKGTEDHYLSSLDDIQNEHDSNEINHDSPSSSDNLVQDCSPVTCQDLLEESRTTSSPLSIPSGRKGPLEEVGRMMESLPNFRSHIDNLEISDVLPPLSCSLDSSSRRLRWELLCKEGSIPCKSNPDSDNGFLKEQDKISNACNLDGLKRMSLEISLCKHLLYEGMGVDAASQAFDAEKVDLEKFASLASAPLKNDRLVVRIGGQYFPWDAAVPIISGMTSFGHEQNFEPEGMIAVDRVEETLEGHSPRAIIASGGSWRWPFSFKRSGTMGSVHPGLDGIRGSDADNAPELSSYLSPDKNVQKIKVTEKKVKSIVPTSEQLASLDLKEGQNVITFTFSTAMLGKQQVDARIYLLKWNTRIVISDVDGTITKSDVLGQFMPLVGKDWSQTGVAHLFSAIEENGYKFLYLSARSVSQAYLTRQFLINLKQDGKALPDGPVVISPDGLFPSLFREVIRRAPHEFKIACLEDIKALFPPDCNPFYAGFGNRDTDEISYLRVGIPKGKIFTINPKGEVAVNRRVDTKSYTSLHALVNGMFPAMSSAGQEEFNSWNFWKVPLPHLDI